MKCQKKCEMFTGFRLNVYWMYTYCHCHLYWMYRWCRWVSVYFLGKGLLTGLNFSHSSFYLLLFWNLNIVMSIHLIVIIQLLCLVQFFATPWTAGCLASQSFTSSQSFLKLMSIELVMWLNKRLYYIDFKN